MEAPIWRSPLSQGEPVAYWYSGTPPWRRSMEGNRPLGDFLRSRRTRLKAEAVGQPTSARRRTPGLKREEVAQRAGISAEWYVKLEQGRAVSPSAETVEALGRALR